MRVPELPMSVWTEERHPASFNIAEVGVAVAIAGGLITPIIRRADQKTLSTISNEMKDFADPRAG